MFGLWAELCMKEYKKGGKLTLLAVNRVVTVEGEASSTDTILISQNG